MQLFAVIIELYGICLFFRYRGVMIRCGIYDFVESFTIPNFTQLTFFINSYKINMENKATF